jgi:hypothetical protein
MAEATKQALKRIEYVVSILREGYVAEGFRLDEDAAARVVAYFRRPSELDFDPEQRFALDWVRDHGQSLDWILSGDPGWHDRPRRSATTRDRSVIGGGFGPLFSN